MFTINLRGYAVNHLKSIIASALICAFASTATIADTVIYLVRHAEKQSEGTHDPSLTERGHKRAEVIAQKLATVGLKAIYSTNYKRTIETAAPTAKLTGLAVASYDPRALEAFANELKKGALPALVVGHSNTTPVVVNFLAGTNYPLLEDHQYDHLYMVTVKDDGTASVAIEFVEPLTP